jgi:outer membrane protein OmpA-like peptidoglycan-associated protein
LSERRAEAVRMVLIDLGVAPSRMVVRGYGKAYPVASNDSPEGRQLNRRVEVVISEDVGRLSARSPRTAP